jgi:hypothetical protein
MERASTAIPRSKCGSYQGMPLGMPQVPCHESALGRLQLEVALRSSKPLKGVFARMRGGIAEAMS